MLATRRPLDTIGMNSVAGSPATRRSARLSADVSVEEEALRKRPRSDANSKGQDGTANSAAARRPKRRKDYDQESDGFVFTKSKRVKQSLEEDPAPAQGARNGRRTTPERGERPAIQDDEKEQPIQRARRQLPTTPERQNPVKTTRKTIDRLREPTKSPFKTAHAESHARAHRSPSPVKALTVEKKRRKQGESHTENRTSRIVLPTSDTPIIRRNKALRQSVANGDRRRSSSGLRGKRVSSMMDEGRWNALPHSDVVASEFYTIISPDLTEPRRMRLLLGWCGDRALPPKVQAPPSSSKQAREDFQASQAARVIQEELSKELSSNGALSEWFSRDIDAPPPKVVLRKKPNPRNIANAAKAEELELELERLKLERKAWEDVAASAGLISLPSSSAKDVVETDGLSPLHPDLLSSPQRAIYQQLTQPQESSATNPEQLQQRLETVSAKLEFTVDSFAHSVHALSTTRDLAERLALRTTRDAARELERRNQDQGVRNSTRTVDALDALRGLAKALNRPS